VRLLFLSLALIGATPAVAAPVYGEKSAPLAVEAMHNFGACVVRFTPSGARGLLAMDFRTGAYNQAMRRLARGHGRCAPRSEIRFNGLLFAGALAEALLETEVKVSDLPRRLARDPSRPVIAARDEVETMALCTVLASPGGTTALFRAHPASAEEAAAVRALAPTLSTCLAQSMQVKLNRPALRSVLALAAWRIASAPRATGQ
jgi:hypothetical protein